MILIESIRSIVINGHTYKRVVMICHINIISHMSSSLDQMTLELLANRRKKGAITKPPTEDNFTKHQKEIKKIVYQLLTDPNTDICADVNDAFDYLVQACVRHIEIKTQKWATSSRYDDELFPTNHMTETYSNAAQIKQHTSLWGHTIHRIMPTIQSYDDNDADVEDADTVLEDV